MNYFDCFCNLFPFAYVSTASLALWSIMNPFIGNKKQNFPSYEEAKEQFGFDSEDDIQDIESLEENSSEASGLKDFSEEESAKDDQMHKEVELSIDTQSALHPTTFRSISETSEMKV